MGAVIKTYYAKRAGIDPDKIVSVSVMPCTAKKFECARPEMNASGQRDVDIVLTTRELACMIRQAGIRFQDLPHGEFDAPLGISTGAATIFGVTGGVMEAALRTVYEIVTKKPLGKIEFSEVRGMDGIKEASVDLGGTEVRVAVAHGLSNASKLLRHINETGERYDFIEVMACPGGCIMGGGQPRSQDPDIAEKRAAALYAEDRGMEMRKSHENIAVACLYEEFLKKPGSDIAHKLLHTTYESADEAARVSRKEAM